MPCCTQSFSCVTIPLGWPQKNGSMIFALVSSCQPPRTITSVAMRAVQSSVRRRRVLLRTSAATAASSAAARSPIAPGAAGLELRLTGTALMTVLLPALAAAPVRDVAVRAYARSTSSRSDSQIWWCSSRKRGSNRISCTAPRGLGRSMS